MPETALNAAQALSLKSEVVLGAALTILASAVVAASALATYNARFARLVSQDALAVALGFASGALLSFVLDALVPAAHHSFEQFTETRSDHWIHPAQASASFLCACAFAIGVVVSYALDALSQYWAATHFARRHRAMRCDDAGESITAERHPAELLRSKIEDEHDSDKLHNLVIPSSNSPKCPNERYHVGIAKIAQFTLANAVVGAAMSVATLQSQTLGVALAVIVVLFNSAESIALSQFVTGVPGMRWRAVLCCVVSSFSLPLGGSIASYIAVKRVPAPFVVGSILSGVGGVLAGSSLAQVLPVCFENAPGQAPRISASILVGIASQAAVRALVELVAA